MGREIVYCSVCGDRLSGTDFEKGRAFTLLKKYFCKRCADGIVKDSADPAHDSTVTPSRPKIRTQRIPLADKAGQAHRNRLPFLIAAGVGIVAVGHLLYVLFAKRG